MTSKLVLRKDFASVVAMRMELLQALPMCRFLQEKCAECKVHARAMPSDQTSHSLRAVHLSEHIELGKVCSQGLAMAERAESADGSRAQGAPRGAAERLGELQAALKMCVAHCKHSKFPRLAPQLAPNCAVATAEATLKVPESAELVRFWSCSTLMKVSKLWSPKRSA